MEKLSWEVPDLLDDDSFSFRVELSSSLFADTISKLSSALSLDKYSPYNMFNHLMSWVLLILPVEGLNILYTPLPLFCEYPPMIPYVHLFSIFLMVPLLFTFPTSPKVLNSTLT